jgi:hypothetical protein
VWSKCAEEASLAAWQLGSNRHLLLRTLWGLLVLEQRPGTEYHKQDQQDEKEWMAVNIDIGSHDTLISMVQDFMNLGNGLPRLQNIYLYGNGFIHLN